MREIITKPTGKSVEAFIESVEDAARRADCREIARMMGEATGAEPRMWGRNTVGFGRYHYSYASGRGADWFQVGFSPGKRRLTLYLTCGLEPFGDLLARLGPHRVGKGCLYLHHLADVDAAALRAIVGRAVSRLRAS